MNWTEKQLEEHAEILFQRACEERGYEATKLPVQRSKTPDFAVQAGSAEFVAEVKSPGLDPQLRQAMGRNKVLSHKLGKRVRDLLKDSAAQLTCGPEGCPRLLVICDLRAFLPGFPMYPWWQFSPTDIADGMFGETQFIFEKRPEGLTPKGPRLGGNRTLRPDHYTHISAICLLHWKDVEQPSGVILYHNPFAQKGFPTTVFVAAEDRHNRLVEKDGELLKRWQSYDAPRTTN